MDAPFAKELKCPEEQRGSSCIDFWNVAKQWPSEKK